MLLRPNMEFGDTFVLVNCLGKGGMGEVWLARHKLLNEFRAIKVMLGSISADDDMVQRFIHGEARNSLNLARHTNIIRVYDLNLFQHIPYIVMEYVESGTLGPTLKHILQPGKALDPSLIDRFLSQIADALDSAHRQAIIHRDVKPANILLDKSGNAKLSDFGLTKDLQAAVSLTLTNAGGMGTPLYMSPEQARGEATHSSDLYSLAVILYQMLTGYLPFTGDLTALLLQHAQDAPPSLRTINPVISPAVEAVVLKALAKQPVQRYPSGAALVEAYRQALQADATIKINGTSADLLQETEEVNYPVEPGKHTVENNRLPTYLLTKIEPTSISRELDLKARQALFIKCAAIVEQALRTNGGKLEHKTDETTQIVFGPPSAAVNAALQILQQIEQTPWPTSSKIQLRLALHTGERTHEETDLGGGEVLKKAQALLEAGNGNQILLSNITTKLVRDNLPENLRPKCLGRYEFPYAKYPDYIYQLNEKDKPVAFPPLKMHRVTFITGQLEELIGRERELERLDELLRNPNCRVLTLTGTGGAGKTSLALQLASQLEPEFEDCVVVVQLETIQDPALVESAIAHSLKLKEVAGQTLLETIQDYLAEKQVLLVLDNFEQVLEAARSVQELIKAAPRLKVLITSREGLNLPGEQLWPVKALGLPTIADHLNEQTRLKLVGQSPAVNLFVQRATQIDPNFQLTAHNAVTVSSICRKLNGLPLAIELVVGLLQGQGLAELDEGTLSLDDLGGSNLVPDHHRTMRGTIEWSYNRLEPNEQNLFDRLCIFEDGFTAQTAAFVCNTNVKQPKSLPPSTLTKDLIQLVKKSLIEKEDTPDGRARYRMLQVLREYGLEKLAASNQLKSVQKRHADYFLTQAQAADQRLKEADSAVTVQWFELEHANLQVALNFYITNRQKPSALQLAASVSLFWRNQGYWSLGLTYLENSLNLKGKVSETLQAKALNIAANFKQFQGEFIHAQNLFEQSLALYQAANSKSDVAFIQLNLGELFRLQNQLESAFYSLEQGLSLARELNDKELIATALNRLGLIESVQGNFLIAQEHYREALKLFISTKDISRQALLHNNLGYVAILLKEYDEANDQFRQSLKLYDKLGNISDKILPLQNIAEVLRIQNRYEEAQRFQREALKLCRQVVDRESRNYSLGEQARLEYCVGNYELASRIMGATEQLNLFDPEETQSIKQKLKENLGEIRLHQLWQQGFNTSLDDLVNEILENSTFEAVTT